jgi:hypothetical protein
MIYYLPKATSRFTTLVVSNAETLQRRPESMDADFVDGKPTWYHGGKSDFTGF